MLRTKIVTVLLFATALFNFYSCTQYSKEVQKMFDLVPQEQRAGLDFLIKYMPQNDLDTLKAELILENLEYAYKARSEFAWCKNLPDSLFYNEVLPYYVYTEPREMWRKGFYERFKKYVAGTTDLRAAIDSINRNIMKEIGVVYNARPRCADQPTAESIQRGIASCTGLSILLVDAFRSVGIPSRLAGTPNWHDLRGNHNWCEVWIDGEWYFTEYYPEKLNQAWFLADAGKADPNNTQTAIYAVSYAPAQTHFPIAWDSINKNVHAYNVTQRYLNIYRQSDMAKAALGNHVKLFISAYSADCNPTTENRIAVSVDVFLDKTQQGGGKTASHTQDANDKFFVLVPKSQTYTLKYGEGKTMTVSIGERDTTVILP